MERRSKKKYSTEFKVEAIRLSNESGKPITQVARDLNITPYLLYRWRDQLHKEGAKAFPGNGSKANLDPETTELQRLRRENKRLQEEKDILKKTILFLAAEEAKSSNASKISKDNTL
jgi:transposase